MIHAKNVNQPEMKIGNVGRQIDFNFLFTAVLDLGIVEGKILWLPCHEGRWYEKAPEPDDFRAWISEEAAKRLLGGGPKRQGL